MAVTISRRLLQQARQDEANVSVNTVYYTDGFVYRGNVEYGERLGYGELLCKDYPIFRGYLKEARKYGGGYQNWPDGESFIGNFEKDRRNGFGLYTFSSGEVFEGTFYEDRRHGYGLNSLPDGSAYFGTFFLDERCGYGLMRYADGSSYEGFFADNQPEGPGIHISAPEHESDKRVFDIGYWRNGKLVRLLHSIDTGKPFVWFEEFPEHAIYSAINRSYFQTAGKKIKLTNEDVQNTCLVTKEEASYQRSRAYKTAVFQLYVAEPVFHGLLQCNPNNFGGQSWPQTMLNAIDEGIEDAKPDENGNRVNLPPCLKLSANDLAQEQLGSEGQLSGEQWETNETHTKNKINTEFHKMRTKNLKAIQKQVTKCDFMQRFIHSAWTNWMKSGHTSSIFVDSGQFPLLNWSVLWEERFKSVHDAEIYDDSGSSEVELGMHEQLATSFLKNCQAGLLEPVKLQLWTNFTCDTYPSVDPNVADQHGCFGLFYAVLAWNESLVNVLLDFGANVNQLTDEGLTALNVALLFYYRIMEQLADHAGTKTKPHLVRQLDQTENTDVVDLEQRKELGSRFIHLAETTILLKDLAIVEDEKQQKAAKLAQMRKLYVQKPPVTSKGKAKLTDEIDAPNAEQQLKLPELRLPTFERFTECLTRLNKQINLRESARQKVEKLDNLVQEEEVSPSRRALLEVPTKAASTGAVNAVARELSKNSYYLNKQTLSTFSREGTMDTQTSSDIVEENQSSINKKAVLLAQKDQIVRMIGLLMKRGADPNIAIYPLPPIFLAVRWGDIPMVKRLLRHGVKVNIRCCVNATETEEQPDLTDPCQKSNQSQPTIGTMLLSLDGLTPLHYAVLLPGNRGVRMVQLLLDAGADPDAQAAPDKSFTVKSSTGWVASSGSEIQYPTPAYEGGRTPLQLVCAREYDHQNAARIVGAMMDQGANPNLSCNGHTALTLAIASGNDLAIDILLKHTKTNVNLKLCGGLGSALAVGAARMFEFRRDGPARLRLLKKLIEIGGASVAMRFQMPWALVIGNVIDATYNDYQQDIRLSRVPYHALSAVEKEVYTSRANILEYLSNSLRHTVYELTGRHREIDPRTINLEKTGAPAEVCGHPRVSQFVDGERIKIPGVPVHEDEGFYPFCSGCGRSIGIRLSPCKKNKSVYYCSKACRMKVTTTSRAKRPARSKSPKKQKPQEETAPPSSKKTVPQTAKWASRSKSSEVLVCRSAGGELLSHWHPAREFQFVLNRYVRVNQKGKIYLCSYDGLGNYSLE